MTGDGSERIVLVHGAWHDGSSWASVVAELTARGHDARAVDLPADRPGAGYQDYTDAVLDAVGPADRVVLVGHSLGGLTTPVVAQRIGPGRVAGLVLVAALVPRPGASWQDRVRSEPGVMAAGFGRGQQRHDDGTTSWPAAEAEAGLYAGVAQESSVAEVTQAVAGLRRQDWAIAKEVTPLTAWPSVPTVCVVCAGDRVVDTTWSRSAAAEIPGAEVVEFDGGHFPMLTRPAELASVIAAVAERSREAGR
ncbi:MAG: alpha/beta hydrolase [Pseudonocardia sp.]|nr:alpha/beta hydrolase [Pseudonocardia sp.]